MGLSPNLLKKEKVQILKFAFLPTLTNQGWKFFRYFIAEYEIVTYEQKSVDFEGDIQTHILTRKTKPNYLFVPNISANPFSYNRIEVKIEVAE